ncbi:ABC transporter ATP-binding protein [Streptomyces sp. WMMB 322]|uniref:ABC transporter ATP-binding protein n=1 Tax=Streptomyces sp. WMMB 322 TaxID=1286821 RepID=UPI0006E41E66|nr:ABC transporter ATP-binding protein [Streptomyces sp. WMMB 322]SCK41932.1 ABC-2 type transport system ATP-binding protein [Streptomyces sp. WMMB 322]
MSELRLRARNLERAFPGGAGVHDMDLDVAAGQIHALVGLNGSGKTTLMRLLLGMLRPDSGSVRLNGCGLGEASATTWAGVGHLVGHPLAYPELDVAANLTMAARLRGVPRQRIPATVTRALAELGLEQYARVRTRVLSSGNLQRLGVAGALQHDPDLIVLDEPTSALDPAGVVLVREALLRRADAGAGVLVSSHHLDEVARTAQRITVVNRGRTIGTLDPDGLDIERSFFALVHADDERSKV